MSSFQVFNSGPRNTHRSPQVTHTANNWQRLRFTMRASFQPPRLPLPPTHPFPVPLQRHWETPSLQHVHECYVLRVRGTSGNRGGSGVCKLKWEDCYTHIDIPLQKGELYSLLPLEGELDLVSPFQNQHMEREM